LVSRAKKNLATLFSQDGCERKFSAGFISGLSNFVDRQPPSSVDVEIEKLSSQLIETNLGPML
jgi:hypothetical protein